jgi:hypothetical protein
MLFYTSYLEFRNYICKALYGESTVDGPAGTSSIMGLNWCGRMQKKEFKYTSTIITKIACVYLIALIA